MPSLFGRVCFHREPAAFSRIQVIEGFFAQKTGDKQSFYTINLALDKDKVLFLGENNRYSSPG